MAAMKFESKAAAQVEADKRVLAGPVWFGPGVAVAEGVAPGWYVGWPQNIRKTLLQTSEISV